MRNNSTREQAVEVVAHIEKLLQEGYLPFGMGMQGSSNITAHAQAAKDLNINRRTMIDLISPNGLYKRRFNLEPDWSLYRPRPEEAVVPLRVEVRDAAFWRTKATQTMAELHKSEHALGVVSGLINDAPPTPPAWIPPLRSTAGGKSVVGALLTDIHFGEVVSPDEILGLNEFNEDIATKRVRRFFDAAVEVGPRWASDTDNVGFLLTLGGDLISGDIHEELRATNSITSTEQVYGCVHLIAAGIKRLLEAYPRVHVVGVPGNHGRTTPKPTAKLYARLSYDRLICKLLQDAFSADARVTFQISTSRDAIVPIFGRLIFINHGDGMGTGGGQGFIGPLAPIVRGTKKVEAQQARANRRPDLILHGHYHTSANPGPVLSNGSVPGYTEYGNGLRAAIEPPQQWLFLLHERWFLRERAEIKLEETTPAALPRVRVPAIMSNG
jgi:hypothetical protein